MSAKPKATININSKTVTSAPAKVPARTVKVNPPKLPAKPVANLKPVRPSVKQPKPGAKTAAKPPSAVTVLPAASHTKQSRLVASLRSTAGVTIEDMMALTGWQAHSIRGAISGALRKKFGLNVVCQTPNDGGQRLYRIAAEA